MQEEGKAARDLILRIYDAAIDPKLWPEILSSVSHFVGASGAFIFEMQKTPLGEQLVAPYYADTYDSELVDAYLKVHHAQEVQDQLIFATYSKTTDEIELIPDRVLATNAEEMAARPNVQAMRKYGVFHRAGALLNKDLVNRDRFAMQFNDRQGALNEEHLRKSSLILPHIAKALNVGQSTTQLAARYKNVVESLSYLTVGVCIIDAERRIMTTNREFDRQLESYDVFRRTADGRFSMSSNVDMSTIFGLIGPNAKHGKFGGRPRKEALVPAGGENGESLCIEILPLNNLELLGETIDDGSIVFSMDSSRWDSFDLGKISRFYSLTPTEESVLQQVASGSTNRVISEMRGTSVETVNSQVKSILSKTMADNRTQLIRIISQTGSFIED